MQNALFAPQPVDPEPVILQLPSAQPPVPDASLTLPECYVRFVIPLMGDAAPKTLADYRGTMRRWEEAMGDVAVRDVDEETLATFRAKLDAIVEPKPLSKSTKAKHLKNVRRVLRVCGPQSYHNPRGRGLLGRLPFVSVPVCHKHDRVKTVRVAPLAEVGRWFAACVHARWPQCSIPAPLLWQVRVMLVQTYGLNPKDLLPLEFDRNILFDARCPDDELELSHPFGWLVYTRTKTHVQLKLPLTPAARALLLELRQVAAGGRKLFPCTTRDNSWLAEQRRIQHLAGIALPYTLQELRKTCNTTWRRIDSDLGMAVLGHREKGVNAQFYTNTIPKICDHILAYPQPAEFVQELACDLATRDVQFHRGASTGFRDPQLRLF